VEFAALAGDRAGLFHRRVGVATLEKTHMKFLLTLIFGFAAAASLRAEDAPRSLLVIVSEPGQPRYETEFRRQAAAWKELGARGKFQTRIIGVDGVSAEGDRAQLEKSLADLPKQGNDLWLVLIGHGSFDDRTANFNLRGKDISATELRDLLKPFERRLILLDLFSASGPFLTELVGKNRVIVSANRSQGERNYSRFGETFADALTAPDADMDRDGSLSLLEATLFASAKVRAFYADAQRVMQEHAVIDDNGDGIATSTENFDGLQAKLEEDAKAPPDGPTAREIFFLSAPVEILTPDARVQRGEIEVAIEALKRTKGAMPEEKYYAELEVLMRRMAALYWK
jgi:hypothetical protein